MPLYQQDDYKAQYKALKRKLKILIYENECFQDELKKSQRSLLRIQRDKSFLLDRLLLYQKGPDSSTDSDQTEESENENELKDNKRKKYQNGSGGPFMPNTQHGSKGSNMKKKKSNTQPSSNFSSSSMNKQLSGRSNSTLNKPNLAPANVSHKNSHRSKNYYSNTSNTANRHIANATNFSNALAQEGPTANSEGPMTREEIERHLAARQPITDFSTTISLTLPNQLFSDNIMEGECLDEEIETSPSNLEDEVTVDSFD